MEQNMSYTYTTLYINGIMSLCPEELTQWRNVSRHKVTMGGWGWGRGGGGGKDNGNQIMLICLLKNSTTHIFILYIHIVNHILLKTLDPPLVVQ